MIIPKCEFMHLVRKFGKFRVMRGMPASCNGYDRLFRECDVYNDNYRSDYKANYYDYAMEYGGVDY